GVGPDELLTISCNIEQVKFKGTFRICLAIVSPLYLVYTASPGVWSTFHAPPLPAKKDGDRNQRLQYEDGLFRKHMFHHPSK
ncbi:hypothetical protein M8C21_010375, partial [Ambrosia artemisiifolia]